MSQQILRIFYCRISKDLWYKDKYDLTEFQFKNIENMWANILFRFWEMSIFKFSPRAMPWLQTVELFGVGPSSVNGNMVQAPNRRNWLKLGKESFHFCKDRVDLLFPISPSKHK